MIGIYKITSPTNRIYIGQSVNIEKRFIRYKRLDCKKQCKLYKSFIKYGVNNHKFEIIEECSLDVLNDLERFYQEKYDCINNGLNLIYTKTKDKSGYASEETKAKLKNRKISQEHKEKIKNWALNMPTESKERFLKSVENRIGKKMIYKNHNMHPNSKKVYQYSRDMQFVKEWQSLAEASKALNIRDSHISECANNKRKSAGNYIFRYIKNETITF